LQDLKTWTQNQTMFHASKLRHPVKPILRVLVREFSLMYLYSVGYICKHVPHECIYEKYFLIMKLKVYRIQSSHLLYLIIDLSLQIILWNSFIIISEKENKCKYYKITTTNNTAV